jgi:hypothetical protein
MLMLALRVARPGVPLIDHIVALPRLLARSVAVLLLALRGVLPGLVRIPA